MLDKINRITTATKITNNVKLFNKIKLKSDTVTIIPVFSDGSLLAIEAYRRGVDEFLLDLPSGLIENNEKPYETAKRELLQETGYSCRTLDDMGWFYTWPSKSNQKSYLFLAKGLEKTSGQNLDAIIFNGKRFNRIPQTRANIYYYRERYAFLRSIQSTKPVTYK
jgi:8-oxo-dGTP pyrophosphatase MutT (NUDIX family)